MSYDLSIADEWFNYTYNLGQFFRDHIPACHSERGGLYELDGLTGKQAVEVLRQAFANIENTYIRNPRFQQEYDAPNGWGTTYGATVFLARVMAACAQHPRHRVRLT